MWFSARNLFIAVLLLALVVWSGMAANFSWTKLLDSTQHLVNIYELWFPPNWDKAETAFSAVLLTLQMAFFGSFVALVMVLPASFLAAKNTTPNKGIYQVARGSFSFLRSIPDIVIGLIFVMAIGPGPFAAVLAILLHNIGVLGKLISELVEAAEKGPQEAIQSVGLGKSMIALYGILPQIMPNILSHYFYRFEVAIRSSIILGFIGGGGIGQYLLNSYRTFQYQDVTVFVLFIVVLVVMVDLLGGYIRNKII